MTDRRKPSEVLLRRLVQAYRPWVEARLEGLGIEASPGLEDALREGERWLEAALDDLLTLPFAEQPRGPLEVFQEAMRFPTQALAEAGAEPVARDPAAERALPGDRYDLAPASTSQLGEQVWRAHLAWGRAKAEAVAPLVTEGDAAASPPPRDGEGVGGSGGHGGPEPWRGEGSFRAAAGPPERRSVGLLTRDLMDRSKVEEAARAAGLAVRVWGRESQLETEVLVALVDLEHPDADAVISRLTEAGITTYAYGPHVDDWALRRARSLGATDALPRSRFFRRLPELLPALA